MPASVVPLTYCSLRVLQAFLLLFNRIYRCRGVCTPEIQVQSEREWSVYTLVAVDFFYLYI